MLIGYAAIRPGTVSETDPHSALIAAGVSRLFIDVLLGDTPRTQLDAAIAAAGPGDALVSASIESLARSPAELFEIVRRLEANGASLRVLHVANMMPLDTASVEGRAMLGALAILHALTPADAARASALAGQTAAGEPVVRQRGRPATAVSQSDEVARLRAKGLRATDIADRLGIGRASVYRILSQSGTAPAAPEQAGTSRAAQVARRLQGQSAD